jgi:hypothetical protein
MSTKYDLSKAILSQQAADELIGYLMLLVEELQLKYCSEEVVKYVDDIGTETDGGEDIPFDDKIPF